uniref:Uncharacterized protein n=1 Tax=Hanusia phi TaxID=3032 RepID=A0A7S0HA83_9CRYP|mmetsp:Transcript_13459/g.31000  ORF Transcript_13459/g.31000 Transcript_13459/m.31000 type:complete len:253 (+) Transcript_13459:76-834(+)
MNTRWSRLLVCTLLLVLVLLASREDATEEELEQRELTSGLIEAARKFEDFEMKRAELEQRAAKLQLIESEDERQRLLLRAQDKFLKRLLHAAASTRTSHLLISAPSSLLSKTLCPPRDASQAALNGCLIDKKLGDVLVRHEEERTRVLRVRELMQGTERILRQLSRKQQPVQQELEQSDEQDVMMRSHFPSSVLREQPTFHALARARLTRERAAALTRLWLKNPAEALDSLKRIEEKHDAWGLSKLAEILRT